MTLRLNGSTSGYVEIDAPATAGSNTLVLPTGNGSADQVLVTNGSGTLSFADRGRIVQGTAQNSTSGTSIDFTGIPSWVKRVTVMFNNVSTNGSDYLLVRLGTASGIEASAIYYAMTGANTSAAVASTANYTTGFGIQSGNASNSLIGQYIISNITGNTWIASGTFAGNTSSCIFAVGRVSLSAVLTQVRITSTGGTNTFDAGSINIMYEG